MFNSDLGSQVAALAAKGEFDSAETLLKSALEQDDQHHIDILVQMARCQLAQEKFTEALQSYRHIQMHDSKEHVAALAEAALVQDDPLTSLKLFKKALEISPDHPELIALLAVNEYLLGYIKHSIIHMEAAVLQEFEWEDESLIDFVIQQVLPVREYHDFEQIYLDCESQVHENKKTKNRWFSLNMPVYDIFSTSDKDKQHKRALHFATRLSPDFDEDFLTSGKEKLVSLLQDLAQSSADPQFGESALNEFENGNYAKISQLILSLLLEHTKQFSKIFGLSQEFIKTSQLQELVPVLPLRMAMALMFLYSSGDPKEKIHELIDATLDEQLYAALLSACFITYYQQIDIYKIPEKEHFETGYT